MRLLNVYAGIQIYRQTQRFLKQNPAALITQTAKAIPARFRVACTGTPVENSLIDLWCLFDFIQPGLLGSLNQFGHSYQRPIETAPKRDTAALEQLRALIEPQTLRRTKQDVAKDLPAKIQDLHCRSLPMHLLQRKLYLGLLPTLTKSSSCKSTCRRVRAECLASYTRSS